MFLKTSCAAERALIMLQNVLFCPVMANMQIKYKKKSGIL